MPANGRIGGTERLLARAKAGAAAFAFAAVLTECTPMAAGEAPNMIEVAKHLGSRPTGVAEVLNEPESGGALRGKLSACRGVPDCVVPIYPGDILMNVKFMAARDGNLEVSVNRMGSDGVVLQSRIDVHMMNPSYEYQLIPFGVSTPLSRTDLAVTVRMSERGYAELRLR
ncbi:MAG: hypothetical protein AB1324_05860 [Candidatus Micrarchaeota archaeon]